MSEEKNKKMDKLKNVIMHEMSVDIGGVFKLDKYYKTKRVGDKSYKTDYIQNALEQLRKEGYLSRKIEKMKSGKEDYRKYYIKELRPSIEKIESHKWDMFRKITKKGIKDYRKRGYKK